MGRGPALPGPRLFGGGFFWGSSSSLSVVQALPSRCFLFFEVLPPFDFVVGEVAFFKCDAGWGPAGGGEALGDRGSGEG